MEKNKPVPSRVTIPIQVTTEDDPKSGTRRGTFISPWPKVLVKKDDLVRWQIKDPQTFALTFIPCEGTVARSPFKKVRVTEKDDFLRVVHDGHFHYKVKVKHPPSGIRFEIRHCPEFQVGN